MTNDVAGVEIAGLRNDGLENDGRESDGLEFGRLGKEEQQIVKLHGHWLRYVHYGVTYVKDDSE